MNTGVRVTLNTFGLGGNNYGVTLAGLKTKSWHKFISLDALRTFCTLVPIVLTYLDNEY